MTQTFEMGPHGEPVTETPPVSPAPAVSAAPAVAGRGRTGLDDDTDLLDLFKQDMAEELAEEDVWFPHKYRDGYSVGFGTDLSGRTLVMWQKRCINQTSRAKEVDAIKLASIILANMNTGIKRRGQLIADRSGDPLTFRSPEFWIPWGATDAAEAVTKFFARDGFLQATAEAVLKACGFDDEATPADPSDG